MPEELTENNARGLVDKYYGELKVAHALDSSIAMGDAPQASREMLVAWAKLSNEKKKVEEREVLRAEIEAIDLSKAGLRKRDAGETDVIYEVRVANVRVVKNV